MNIVEGFEELVKEVRRQNAVKFIQIKIDGYRDYGLPFTVINKNGRVADCSAALLETHILEAFQEELDG